MYNITSIINIEEVKKIIIRNHRNRSCRHYLWKNAVISGQNFKDKQVFACSQNTSFTTFIV